LHRLPQHPLDLAIDAAEFLRGPGFQVGPEGGVDAEEEGFAVCHGEFASDKLATNEHE
jgi:hypothetical protein